MNFHLSEVQKNYFYFWISGPYRPLLKQSVQGVQQDINDLMAPKTQVLTLAKHSPGLNDGPDSSQAGSLCSICSHSSIVWKIFENTIWEYYDSGLSEPREKYLEKLNPALSWLNISIWSFKTGGSSHGTFHDWTIVSGYILHACLNVVWCGKGDSGDEKWKFHFWKYDFEK